MIRCGGWRITGDAINFPVCNLPEEVASAFTEATSGLSGAEYEPLMFTAAQETAGANYMILCRETMTDEDFDVVISAMTITVPMDGEPQIFAVDRLF